MSEQSIEETLEERGNTHGDWKTTASVTQHLMTMIRMADQKSPQAHTLDDPLNESVHMICHKLARIAAGDCRVRDHWHDIAGYAKLAIEVIEQEINGEAR
jgi:hypothetical protein